MLMLKILENDLHRSRNENAVPLIVEVPAQVGFLPALVSNSVGEFLTSRKLTAEKRIRVGVFKHDPDKIDQVIPTMMKAALDLSRAEGWPNVFGPSSFKDAFDYVKKESGMPAQPHVCLAPSAWSQDQIERTFRASGNILKYRKYCRIVSADLEFSVFLSRPDMVGLYTHFSDGGSSAILMHNVRRGMAFCA